MAVQSAGRSSSRPARTFADMHPTAFKTLPALRTLVFARCAELRSIGGVKVTCDHAASSYGIPVILDDRGLVMDYGPGIKAARTQLGFSVAQLAETCGVSERTLNGWEQGRMPSTAALNVLEKLLRHH